MYFDVPGKQKSQFFYRADRIGWRRACKKLPGDDTAGVREFWSAQKKGGAGAPP